MHFNPKVLLKEQTSKNTMNDYLQKKLKESKMTNQLKYNVNKQKCFIKMKKT